MKKYAILFLLLCSSIASHAQTLVPSGLDPVYADAREKAFTPWSNPEESSATWNKLASNHVPIYYERKDGNLSRDIYIRNPGIPYWVLAGLTKENLFKIHREKLEIDDTLVSASVYQDNRGNDIYWALWAPRQRAHLLTDKMTALGITQARIEYSPIDQLENWIVANEPTALLITWLVLALTIVLLTIMIGLFVSSSRQH